MFIKLALRNIFRQRWRSAFTIAGVAAATLILVWTQGLIDAFMMSMVRGATAVDVGQLQLRTRAYDDKISIFSHFEVSDELLGELRALDGVAGASPRVHAFGLVGTQTRSQVARIVGVDPLQEPKVTRIVSALQTGQWLSPSPSPDAAREVVLGQGLAQQLGVGTGDELVLFLQGVDGSLGNDLLRVRGLVRTGNTAIDRSGVFMHLAELQYLSALDGRAHEITLAVPQFDRIDDLQRRVQAMLPQASHATEQLVVRQWKELLPQLAQMFEVSSQSMWFIYFFVYVIAGIGILNTQRMSALERRREFGVLLAIGLSPRQLGAVLMLETMLLTMIGPLLGAILGLALNHYYATFGFDMSLFSDVGSFSYLGVAFDDKLYFEASLDQVWAPMGVIACFGVLCGLVPALGAMRLDAVRSIAGRS